MRLRAVLVFAIAIMMSVPASAGEGTTVRVEPGGWGRAKAADIARVLGLVAEVMLKDFPEHAGDRFVVQHGSEGPKALFRESPGDPYRIVLQVEDARWDQFAYQFSHELCHVFSNFERRKTAGPRGMGHHQWFEESLCEAVSLVVLERVALAWAKSPPRGGWESYAPAFSEYAQRLRSQAHRHLHGTDSMARWLDRHGSELERNPYARDKNELIATSLHALLDARPGCLKALAYLNLGDEPLQKDFAGYLEDWLNCCPETGRGFIRDVISLLSDGVAGGA
jgi:hypothetical protein